MKLIIEMDVRELKITGEEGTELAHIYSQVPSHSGNEKRFNRLREIALSEWIDKCVHTIDGIVKDKITRVSIDK